MKVLPSLIKKVGLSFSCVINSLLVFSGINACFAGVYRGRMEYAIRLS